MSETLKKVRKVIKYISTVLIIGHNTEDQGSDSRKEKSTGFGN
jgi:hypothetical protein